MSSGVVGTVTASSGKVGRYFTVVSTLPAVLLVAYTYVLVRVAGTGPVNWSALAEVELHEVALLGLAALVLALATNPLQFAMIQVFEGYWGSSKLGVALATARTAHHRRRLASLREAESSADAVARAYDPEELRYGDAPVEVVHAAITITESQRSRSGYPDITELLPTRLGNVLRRYENSVGAPYGLDPLSTVPRLAMVGGDREVAYVQDQRTQLELATRTTFVALCATLVTLVVMGRHGVWMLLAVVPYSVAFFAYRGAVALAHEYGTSLAVLTDLSRFDLYDRLRLKEVHDGDEERARNAVLMRIFDFDRTESLSYGRPPQPASDPVRQAAGESPPENDSSE